MSSDREKKVDEFVAITGGTREIANSLLAVCNDNLEMAINMHMEGVATEDVGASNNQPQASSSHTSNQDDEGKKNALF
jgi:hypothetical protein